MYPHTHMDMTNSGEQLHAWSGVRPATSWPQRAACALSLLET